MSSLARDGFFAGFDEDDPRSPDPGPADSHYELTEEGEVAPDDSVDDWPAVSPSGTPSDPWLAAEAEPAATEVPTRDPWYYKLIDDFGHQGFDLCFVRELPENGVKKCSGLSVRTGGPLAQRRLIGG